MHDARDVCRDWSTLVTQRNDGGRAIHGVTLITPSPPPHACRFRVPVWWYYDPETTSWDMWDACFLWCQVRNTAHTADLSHVGWFSGGLSSSVLQLELSTETWGLLYKCTWEINAHRQLHTDAEAEDSSTGRQAQSTATLVVQQANSCLPMGIENTAYLLLCYWASGRQQTS